MQGVHIALELATSALSIQGHGEINDTKQLGIQYGRGTLRSFLRQFCGYNFGAPRFCTLDSMNVIYISKDRSLCVLSFNTKGLHSYNHTK